MAPLHQKLGALLALGLSLTVHQTVATPTDDAKLYSSVPKDNAFRIFNSVHSAMRQWGSSLDHNGFGLVPAVVPRGTVLYHGTHTNTTPTEPEWLAFELEHARLFARSLKEGSGFPMPPGGGRPPPDGDKKRPGGDGPRPPPPADLDQLALTHDSPPHPGPPGDGHGDDGKEPSKGVIRGWFHVYQAKRDLKLLYFDGMSAGKTDMGTLDTQDYVLRDLEPNNGNGKPPVMNERERADDICSILVEWGFDGHIRMEIGFEVILCDFSSGLDLISANRQPTVPKGDLGPMDMRLLMVARAASQRYQGIGAGRVKLDWSAATSALFYPVNISSWWPDRPDLVRIGSASREDRMTIKDDVRKNAMNGRERQDSGAVSIDWQAIVDMIVSRYSSRIASLASGLLTPGYFLQELAEVVEPYVMYPPEDDDVLPGGSKPGVLDSGRITPRYIPGSCQAHYLLPATMLRSQWTESDENYFTAIDYVVKEICSAFFAAQKRISRVYEWAEEDHLLETVNAEVDRFRTLKRSLAWSTWVQCEKCQDDEVCYIAMWPFGTPEDHWAPRCKNATLVGRNRQGPSESYWNAPSINIQADEEFGTMEL